MHLIQKPYKPSRAETQQLRIGREQYRSWKAFLNNAYWTVELKEE
jgi:hypothetical protein